jgi:mono/diheme cytochrome c family protein
VGPLTAIVGVLSVVLGGASAPSNGRIAAAPRPTLVKAAGQPATAALASQQALVARYCVSCHSDRLKTGGLSLERLSLGSVGEHAPVWEKVVRKLRAGAMPPAGSPRPARSDSDALAVAVETALDRAAAASPNPGRPGVHRLNRAEYANAIRDLLDLEIDGRSFLPSDDAMFGFDSIADVLSVSPGLLERYLSAAGRISRLAVGDPTIAPTESTFDISKDVEQNDRAGDDLPFGTRGGMAIRHDFPVDGEYGFRVFLQRTTANYESVFGLHESNRIEVSLDGDLVTVFDMPARASGDIGKAISANDFSATHADKDLHIRVAVKAGLHVVGVALMNTTRALEGLELEDLPPGDSALMNVTERMGIRRLAITGPFSVIGPGDAASRKRIFSCRPVKVEDEMPCARKVLATLAQRAYRRPPKPDDLDTLLTFFKTGRSGGSFDAGIQKALERVLVDPDFLFRCEYDPATVAGGTPYPISDVELASRLSFFLWSTIPDDELLAVASRGRLRVPAVLEEQVRRMLKDPRSKALVENFASQWLWQRNLRTLAPDPYAFPEFDDSLRQAFEQETRLFVESQIAEDRGLPDLLTANYTFVNERLARHYGIPNIYGNNFRRVTLPDATRGGLLGQGSILMVTSYSTRTSPVVRGKWILENILGSPPPNPPANVPPLKDDGHGKAAGSMRERMEQHRQSPACASCHARMDPIGFSLENFDGIGAWRTTDAGVTIDSTGIMPDGRTYQGLSGLRNILSASHDRFVATVAEKLLIYALGRGVDFYDQPAIRRIVRDAAANDYRWSSIVLGIAKSVPFQMRINHPPPAVATGQQ